MKIRELHIEQRPREKAMLYGIENLSDRELLALIIRCGLKGKSALMIADEVLSKLDGLHALYSVDESLLSIKGISKIKLLELQCISELSKRMAFSKIKNTQSITSAKMLGNWLRQQIGYAKQEHFLVVYLDIKNKIIHFETLFIGTLDSSVVHPREIFKQAMKYSASKLIIAHNHPSGDTTYSLADKQVTKTIIEVGKLCGIPLLDHVIVGKDNVFSFRENKIVAFE